MLAAATVTEPDWTLAHVDGDHRNPVAARPGAARVWRARPDAGRDRRRPARRRDGAAHDRFADQDRDDDRGAARGRRPSRSTVRVSGVAKGVGMIHPQMATMLSVILTDADGRARGRCGDCSGRPRRGPGTSSRSMATRARTTPSSSSRPGRRGPPRPRPDRRPLPRSARRSRRSRATWRGSRRPTARAPATLITAAVTGARDDAEARARRPCRRLVEPGQGGGARPRPELGPRSRERPATRGWPIAAVLEAAGLSAAEARPVPAPRSSLDPATGSGSRSPATSSSTARGRSGRVRPRGGAGRDGRRGSRDRARPRSRRRRVARPSAAT